MDRNSVIVSEQIVRDDLHFYNRLEEVTTFFKKDIKKNQRFIN